MPGNNQQTATADPFTQFWSDMTSRMSGVMPPASGIGAPSAEALKQMQRVFLDALAKYCDEYMRSEQFLQMMKETLDRSLAFKQQMDKFLGQIQRGMGAPAGADIDDIPTLLRTIEDRLVSRIDNLEQKVAAVEEPRVAGRGAGESRARRLPPRGTASRKAKRPTKGKKK